ncbi:MAG: PEP-CTERM sorting domain-containing protein [Cyanophyceae cyanobacterium]
MNTRFLSGAIAGIAAVSTVAIVAPAQAGTLTYSATEFKEWNGSSGHAFWFSGLYNDGLASDKHFVFKDDSGMFTVDGNTATLMGTIVNVKAADEIWDVNISFESTADPGKYKFAPGGNSTAGWDFYDFAPNEISLVGQDAYAGSNLSLTQADTSLAVQAGVGANDKDKNELGLSSWFNASGTVNYKGETVSVDGSYGDINIDLDPKSVPEPTSVLGIGAVALGLAGMKRNQRNAK